MDPAASSTILQTVLDTEAPAGLQRRAHGIQRRNKVCRMYDSAIWCINMRF